MKGRFTYLGQRPYGETTKLQETILGDVLEGQADTLLLLQHDPVLTLGANFHAENLLLTEAEYAAQGIEVVRTGRGGDVTFHGPGQLVIYPIFNLERHGKDLHKWMRELEETMILTARHFGLEAYRFPPNTGAWVNGNKLAAIGVKVRKWVSMHGIALNCGNDLAPFETIIPCGIQGYGVTSITKETGGQISVDQAWPVVKSAFEEVFDLELDLYSTGTCG